MRKFFSFCVNRPYLVIGAILIITVLAALQIPTLKTDPRAEIFMERTNPVRDVYEKNREEFVYNEETYVGVVGENVLEQKSLHEVDEISREMAEIGLVRDVQNILNIDYISGDEMGIRVSELAPDGEVPSGPEDLARYKARIDSWDFFRGLFISADYSGTLISLIMQEGTETDAIIPVYYQMLDIVDKVDEKYQGRNKIFITGVPVINALMGDYMLRDMRIFVPIVNLVIIIVLYALFRNIRGVVLPLVTVGVATTWTLALMALLKWPLTQVSGMLPVMTTAIGIAYGIHVLENIFSDAAAGKRGKEGIVGALSRVSIPVIMAGLTTMGGFISLSITEVVPIKQLGVLASFGVMASCFISMTLIPAVLSIMDGIGKEFIPEHHSRRDVIGPFLRFFSAASLRHSTGVIVVCLLILLVSVIGTLKVKSDMDPVKNFKADSSVRQADDFMNARFSGTSMSNVVFNGSGADDVKNPEVLRMIDELQQQLKKMPQVGKVISIVDLLKRMNQVMHDDDPDYYTIPETRELVAQYLLLYSFSGGDELDRFVNMDFSKAQILLVNKSQASALADHVLAYVDEFNRERLSGSERNVIATGVSVMTREFNRIVVNGQISSFALAFVLVMLVTMLIFKSVKLGLYSALPLIIPIMINFSIMGFMGIALNAATAIIASLTLGIGIDYSIHFLSRYRHEIELCGDVEHAIATTINTSGRAIMYNALAVALGNIVLVLSSFVPVIQSGFLTFFVMITSSVAALTVLPAFIVKFHPRITALASSKDDHFSTTIGVEQEEKACPAREKRK